MSTVATNNTASSKVTNEVIAVINNRNSTQEQIFKALDKYASSTEQSDINMQKIQSALESKNRRAILMSNLQESQDNTTKALINNMK